MPMVIISATAFIHMLMMAFRISCPTSVPWGRDGDGKQNHGNGAGTGLDAAGMGAN